jgi:hypothetical protein
MSQHETVRPASEIEKLIIEPHASRWLEAQQKLQAVVQAIAPEPGAVLDLDSWTWRRPPTPLAEMISSSAALED